MRLLVITALLCFCVPAYAGFETGNKLYKECTSTKSDSTYYQSNAYCTGYVTGVFDHFASSVKPEVLCLDGNITAGQSVKIFIAYADKHPELLNRSAELLVQNAIFDAFKCRH